MNNARNSILLAILALVLVSSGAVAAANDLRPGEAVIGETNGLIAASRHSWYLSGVS